MPSEKKELLRRVAGASAQRRPGQQPAAWRPWRAMRETPGTLCAKLTVSCKLT